MQPNTPSKTDGRQHPHVVFAVEMPTPTCHRPAGAKDDPELSLPFVHAADVEEAVSLVAGPNYDNPDYVVVDAMDYDRLMEIADMLEKEDPSYPKGAKAVRRPLDIGWAVRRLKAGQKVRFHNWNKGEYIVKDPSGLIVDGHGMQWRPSQVESLASAWEVYE